MGLLLNSHVRVTVVLCSLSVPAWVGCGASTGDEGGSPVDAGGSTTGGAGGSTTGGAGGSTTGGAGGGGMSDPVCLCHPGEFRCNEEFLLSCNDTCDGWSLAETCSTPELCDEGASHCRACEIGTRRCNGQQLELCSEPDGVWESLAVCTDDQTCNPNPEAGADCIPR